MKAYKALYIFILIAFLASTISFAQGKRKISIDYSGFLTKDEIKYPGATVFTRDDMAQVKISHAGAIMWADRAIHYVDEDFIEAFGNVRIIQGDTINMTSKYVEYSGVTQIAFASGDVILKEPASTLETDTLYFDRLRQQAFYKSYGKVVRDSSGTITSKIGRYYMEEAKYQFVEKVKLVNEENEINTDLLDYYTETGRAYIFGPSTITGDGTNIYCERGFYDTTNELGYFLRNSRIDYDNRIVEGDSIFFDQNRNFASATNNIKVTDTINNAIVKGHYAEVFKDKDSVFITKRALAITVQETDSIYIHGDTLMITGDKDNRITRAFNNVKLFKSDLSGKADSIHVNHQTGLTQLMNLERFSNTEAFSTKRNPVLWNIGNQITGDSIHLLANPETEELDSLKVFDDAFIVSKDTLGEGYNQIKGRTLTGLFKENKLYLIDIVKNAESVYYTRNENNELVGIDKAKSGSIKIWITDNTIDELRRIKQIDGKTYPEAEMPEPERILRGFVWREDERPKSIKDLFSDDPPINLPIIKGLQEYIPQEDFFDEDLISRVESANKPLKENKASRQIPKKNKKPQLDEKDESKTKRKPLKKDNNN